MPTRRSVNSHRRCRRCSVCCPTIRPTPPASGALAVAIGSGDETGSAGTVVVEYASGGNRADVLAAIVKRSESGRVTLVYAARDRDHNNAVALRNVIEGHGTEG